MKMKMEERKNCMDGMKKCGRDGEMEGGREGNGSMTGRGRQCDRLINVRMTGTGGGNKRMDA